MLSLPLLGGLHHQYVRVGVSDKDKAAKCELRLTQCSKPRRYSIISLAVICMMSGTVRPSALAVLKLITNSRQEDRLGTEQLDLYSSPR